MNKTITDILIEELKSRGYIVEKPTEYMMNRLTTKEWEMLNLFIDISKENIQHTLILSGSLALKLHGVRIERECKDLDIAVDCEPYEIKLPSEFKIVNKFNQYAASSKRYKDNDSNIIIDMFKSNPSYCAIGKYKVSNIEQIKKCKEEFIEKKK